MEILLISERLELKDALATAIGREEMLVRYESSAQVGLFLLLQGEHAIEAIVFDAAFVSTPLNVFFETLTAAGLDCELLVIGPESIVLKAPPSVRNYCCGLITDELQSLASQMMIKQLTEKINLKRQLTQLRDSSITDGLTRMFNHAFMKKQVAEEVARLQQGKGHCSLIFVDIDHFKSYNDRNGHPAGDDVLRRFASLLTRGTRRFDFCGRYGGEEFVVLLPGIGIKKAVDVAERLRKMVAETPFPEGHHQPLGRISASFGVATVEPGFISGPAELLFHADQALYRAKKKGRNRVWYAFEGGYHPFGSGS
jgi:diguanylate cyclase (GGDEF)-like protein